MMRKNFLILMLKIQNQQYKSFKARTDAQYLHSSFSQLFFYIAQKITKDFGHPNGHPNGHAHPHPHP